VHIYAGRLYSDRIKRGKSWEGQKNDAFYRSGKKLHNEGEGEAKPEA
jgi:hypothetical protein